MKKPILYGGSIITLGALAALGMSSGNKEHIRKYQGPIRTVSGEIMHIDEDSYVFWDYQKAGNVTFENLRVKDGKGLVHKLIHLGPSSYKVGDKVKGLEYTCLEHGISLEKLNKFLTYQRSLCQKGYVQAHGIIN